MGFMTLSFYYKILKRFNRRHRTVAIFFDRSDSNLIANFFMQVFDLIDHDPLYFNIDKYDMRGSAHNWMKSHL